MLAQVVGAPLIRHVVAPVPLVVKGGAVLGDEHAARGIVLMDAQQDVSQTLGVDFPGHLRIAGARNRGDILVTLGSRVMVCCRAGRSSWLACPDDGAGVVIDAQKIERGRDERHILAFNRRRRDSEVGK